MYLKKADQLALLNELLQARIFARLSNRVDHFNHGYLHGLVKGAQLMGLSMHAVWYAQELGETWQDRHCPGLVRYSAEEGGGIIRAASGCQAGCSCQDRARPFPVIRSTYAQDIYVQVLKEKGVDSNAS